MLPFEPSREDFADEILKAAIDYTISQDFAAGHSAEQGRRLRGFHGEGNSNDSTYVPWFYPPSLSQRSHITPGNHALQDYQMQLMLLEQQNKKRLLMARQEQDEDKELAQIRTEHLELSRKRRKLNATANDGEENLTSTSATTGQVTNGLDQASNYEVPSLDKISFQQTDVCRCSLAISEFSIRSTATAMTNIHTTVQTFSRTRHSRTVNLLAKSILWDGLPSMILKNS